VVWYLLEGLLMGSVVAWMLYALTEIPRRQALVTPLIYAAFMVVYRAAPAARVPVFGVGVALVAWSWFRGRRKQPPGQPA
jgi:hypothetical protein